MNIKEKLKVFGIKLGELSEELKITRPTLSSYIATYEAGEKITNSKYQFIFEKLFNEDVVTEVQFRDTLDKFHSLLERDEVLGTIEFDVDKTDLLSILIKNAKKDLSTNDYDSDIYVFMNFLLSSYHQEKIFSKFAKYFIYLNGLKDPSHIQDNEKAFFSNCFKLMTCEKNSNQIFDEGYYNRFLNRIEEIQKRNDEKSKEKITELINERINQKVREQLELGANIESIDFKKIISEINFKS